MHSYMMKENMISIFRPQVCLSMVELHMQRICLSFCVPNDFPAEGTEKNWVNAHSHEVIWPTCPPSRKMKFIISISTDLLQRSLIMESKKENHCETNEWGISHYCRRSNCRICYHWWKMCHILLLIMLGSKRNQLNHTMALLTLVLQIVRCKLSAEQPHWKRPITKKLKFSQCYFC